MKVGLLSESIAFQTKISPCFEVHFRTNVPMAKMIYDFKPIASSKTCSMTSSGGACPVYISNCAAA
jgi:hypothetical protein